MDPKLELISKVPLFGGCNRRSIEEIGRLAEEVDVPAGKVLMREGETGDAFYVVVNGTVSVERSGAEPRMLGPGDFLGEIALVDHGRRTATATCVSDCRLLVLGHREFDQLLDRYPEIRGQVLAALADRVRGLEPNAPH